jgi:hypothetical protein
MAQFKRERNKNLIKTLKDYRLSYLPIAPMRHIMKSVAKRASISLSSFLSKVLLLEGTFMEFIMTCD